MAPVDLRKKVTCPFLTHEEGLPKRTKKPSDDKTGPDKAAVKPAAKRGNKPDTRAQFVDDGA
jgi:hypothetical protein